MSLALRRWRGARASSNVPRVDQGSDSSDLPSIAPGTVIGGKYRIEGLIGRGGMGSVWAAAHVNLGQRVAIKLIAHRYAASREARQRFDLEAKAAAQLRSRFVVQVFDNGETDDGIPYIVMELLEGESLDQRISRRGAVPVVEVDRILAQVGRALTKAHELGIVHRDLKPENIFLARSNDDDAEVAKVLDFGIAKMKTSSGDLQSGTRTGAVIGTPLFMSPEQARGLKSVDHRTDVYSLGMVSYTMLTGQAAFSGESFGDLLLAVCTQPLPPLLRAAPSLPPALDGWFQRACAREPGDRFQSAQELVDAFHVAAGLGGASALGGSKGIGTAADVSGTTALGAAVGLGAATGLDAGAAQRAQSASDAAASGAASRVPIGSTAGEAAGASVTGPAPAPSTAGFAARPGTTSALEVFEPKVPKLPLRWWMGGAAVALLIGGAVIGMGLARHPGGAGVAPAASAVVPSVTAAALSGQHGTEAAVSASATGAAERAGELGAASVPSASAHAAGDRTTDGTSVAAPGASASAKGAESAKGAGRMPPARAPGHARAGGGEGARTAKTAGHRPKPAASTAVIDLGF